MEAVKCAARSGSDVMLPHAVVNGLRSRILGRVLGPDDEGYDRARMVFNAMIDRRPALIVQCAAVADIREAVMFAGEHNLLASIRGGGHGVTGTAVCTDGLITYG
jgi:FAD/FMN-containing dehydrogenase